MLPPIATRLLSERLELAPPRARDVGSYRHALRKNQEHLRPWMPKPKPGEDPTSLTTVATAITRHRREWRRGEAFVFVVREQGGDGAIIGRVALFGVMRGVFQNAHLGYWIAEDKQTQGMTTEAVRRALDFAFGEAALHRVEAAVVPRNTASLRVLDKCRFRREGVAERYLCVAGAWEDYALFAITREEWVAP
jgi:ribosomal-protein-alanine N-acetyltransferase